MQRREMIKAVLIGGLLGAIRPAGAAEVKAEVQVGERVTPITGPDHPLAPKKTLVYGLGITAENILIKATDEGFIGDYWVMWAGVRNSTSETEVHLWETSLYPFAERNMSHLSILTRLGDRGADLVARIVVAWRDRVPVDVLLLDPELGASDSVTQLAARQSATLAALVGVELIRVGRSEEDAQRFLDIRSGWTPPESL